MPRYPSFEERFFGRFKKDESGCWLTNKPGATGYGSVEKEGKSIPMHRASWMIHKGEIQKGLCVLHRCDNRACCNPKHLYLGTKKDNRRDFMKRHPRAQEIVQAGIKAGSAGVRKFWSSMSKREREEFVSRRAAVQQEKRHAHDGV